MTHEQQVNEVLEKIRGICDLKKLEFGCEVLWNKKRYVVQQLGGVSADPTLDKKYIQVYNGKPYGEAYPKKTDVTIIGLPVQLNHLLWALGETQGVYDGYFLHTNGWLMWEKAEGGHTKTKQLRCIDLQKSVEDNLLSSPELTKWVHGVIIGKE